MPSIFSSTFCTWYFLIIILFLLKFPTSSFAANQYVPSSVTFFVSPDPWIAVKSACVFVVISSADVGSVVPK